MNEIIKESKLTPQYYYVPGMQKVNTENFKGREVLEKLAKRFGRESKDNYYIPLQFTPVPLTFKRCKTYGYTNDELICIGTFKGTYGKREVYKVYIPKFWNNIIR